MWEVLVRTPLGRHSRRKFVVLVATLLVAVFGYVFVASTPVFAAEATWKDDSIVYNSHTYEGPQEAIVGDDTSLETGTTYYEWHDDNTKKAYLIYFAPGTDPPTEQKATLATYQITPTNLTGPTDKQPITIAPAPATQPNEDEGLGGDTSCAVNGIGWIVCPVTKFLATGMDWIYDLIDGFLEVRTLSNDYNQPMYRAWLWARDMANILFVIGFLILVYAQISGGMLNNYTIKRTLPRIIIAAMLVNVSYWICAVAIDVFNILGYGAQDIFIQARNTLVGSEGNTWDVVSWERFSDLVLSGGAIVGGGAVGTYLGVTSVSAAVAGAGSLGAAAGGLIILLLPALISLLFVVMVVFLILAARQALITVLVIIAPLAFVAYLLPNTEKWFERWQKTFITMLFMFPAFSVIFGGSQFASAVIIQNANSLGIILLGMVVQLAPLAITPLLLKLGGGVMARISGIINNPTKGVFDRGKNWARERSDANKARGLASLAERSKRMGYTGRRPGASNRATRRGRAAENIGNRLNPYNATYAREYNRRQREGMKAANEAMTEGLFGQTAAGQQVYARNKDAGLEKHFGEASNARRYNTAMATGANPQDTYRRHLHHQSHIDEGVSKVFEESLANHAEHDLQAQIRDTPQLRNLKVQANIDAGLADAAKQIVEAEGKWQLQETTLASAALMNQARQTHEYKGRAEQASQLIEDNSKAAWEQLTLDDRTIYSRQLERQANAKSLKALQSEWESILTEASAGRTDDYQRRHGPITQHVAEQIDVIRVADRTIAVEEKRKANADYVFKNDLTTELKTDDALLARAAGIDEYGRTKVVAQLYKEGSALWMQNVEAVESTFSNEGYTPMELIKAYQTRTLRNGEPASELHIHAAMRQLLSEKGNNTSVQKMIDFVGTQSMNYDDATGTFTDSQTGNILDNEEVERRRNLQQVFVDAFDKSPHKATHVSGTDRSDMRNGLYKQSTRTAIVRDIATGKIKADRVGNMDLDEMLRSVQVFRDYPQDLNAVSAENRLAYINVIDEAMNDPIIGAKLEVRHRRLLESMKAYLNPADTRSSTEKDALAGRTIPTGWDPLTMSD